VTQFTELSEEDFKTSVREPIHRLSKTKQQTTTTKRPKTSHTSSPSNDDNNIQQKRVNSKEKYKNSNLNNNSKPFRIVLSHNPDSCDVIKYFDVDMVVCGHTHGKPHINIIHSA
jgi:predicted MPP superfamily phosphohydrolase